MHMKLSIAAGLSSGCSSVARPFHRSRLVSPRESLAWDISQAVLPTQPFRDMADMVDVPTQSLGHRCVCHEPLFNVDTILHIASRACADHNVDNSVSPRPDPSGCRALSQDFEFAADMAKAVFNIMLSADDKQISTESLSHVAGSGPCRLSALLALLGVIRTSPEVLEQSGKYSVFTNMSVLHAE
ncbi:hypothetical protein GGX14DRAFT_674271 [Mycena pura]|uniref:Uncharacterized protein n=1 Tax=Mycena pura TaxID=153505 RepID=A0AAD6UW00_9AGAR|nr:hypothetical protein GGX14DRAFT_674271 [Mycena pura]